MKELARLQRSFQRHVLRPGRAMAREVLETSRAGAARRLSVYADAYRLRLAEALGKDYPALRRLLGEPRFRALLLDFMAAQPSRFANLRWYGGSLARFLGSAPRWRGRPLLAELAEFEWALGLAFDAADAAVLDAGSVARVPAQDWPAMRLRLHPSVRLLGLRSNAPRLWRHLTGGMRTTRPRLRREPATWLIWRKVHTPFFRAVAADEAWALRTIGRGADFAALCAGLRRFAGRQQAAARAVQLLRNWLAEGLLCGLETRSAPARRRPAQSSSAQTTVAPVRPRTLTSAMRRNAKLPRAARAVASVTRM
jgi:hypothetical protein